MLEVVNNSKWVDKSLFRMMWADAYTFTAIDASILDDVGSAIAYPDGLGGTPFDTIGAAGTQFGVEGHRVEWVVFSQLITSKTFISAILHLS
jgi:hypothetical protein